MVGPLLKGFIIGVFERLLTAIFKTPLATLTFLYAGVGGMAMTETFLGDWISDFLNLFWEWVPAVATIIAFGTILIDLFWEGTAERLAIYLALVTPSMAMSIPEDAPMHEDMSGWIEATTGWFADGIGTYIGATGAGVMTYILTFTAIVGVTIVCEKYGKRTGTSTSGRPAGPGAAPAAGPARPAVRRPGARA